MGLDPGSGKWIRGFRVRLEVARVAHRPTANHTDLERSGPSSGVAGSCRWRGRFIPHSGSKKGTGPVPRPHGGLDSRIVRIECRKRHSLPLIFLPSGKCRSSRPALSFQYPSGEGFRRRGPSGPRRRSGRLDPGCGPRGLLRYTPNFRLTPMVPWRFGSWPRCNCL